MPFYRFLRAASWPVVCGLFRLRATGMENVPATGGGVLAANHVSNFDPWPLGMPLYPRQLRFMGKSELFNPLLTPFLRAGGAFPVQRGKADLAAIETAVELVRTGELVMMFPEGTRRKKGLAKKYQPRPHSVAARIALEARAPLIPAAICGMDSLLRLGPLRVGYGPPVPVDDLFDQEPKQAARIATERLMAAIERLKAVL